MEPPSWTPRFNRLRQLFWLFFLLTIGYMIWLREYLSPLSSGEIVRFETAKTAENAAFILRNWKATGKYEQGLKSTSLAYLFIIFYTVAIAIGCRFLPTCTGNEILSKGGRGFAWLILVAAICDVVENIAMYRTMLGNVSQANVTLAYNLSRIKFSIVIICLLFMLACVLYWAIGKLARTESNKIH